MNIVELINRIEEISLLAMPGEIQAMKDEEGNEKSFVQGNLDYRDICSYISEQLENLADELKRIC